MGGRVTLINSSLTSVPLYMLSFYRIPVGVREKIDMVRKKIPLEWGQEQKEAPSGQLAHSLYA